MSLGDLTDGVAVGAPTTGRGSADAHSKSQCHSRDALVARVAELQKKAAREKRDRLPGVPLPRDVVQLPLWPDSVRGVPNGFLRSALFGAIAKGRRRYMPGERVATLDGLTIIYTGERLDQGDLDVWESVLHAVRLQALGEQCRVTSYALLKLMGKTDTGKNRKVLHARITRLRANAVEIKQDRYSYIGGLVDEAYKDNETQEWVIVVSPKLRALFGTDQFTQIDWTVRRALGGRPLAQWLHGFYASHAKPYPMRTDTLLKLAGSEDESPSSGRQTLRKALDALAEAGEAHGQPFSYDIRGDLVHVEKKPSDSQRRHLVKKAGGQRKRRP
ncbi:plasmid replication initiator TrfA [Paraburkholderia bonniea]|uniref:plasmid replication initiator TrfA n=1 Tax=Paraburkholderia bonniea TaxID=2152891 RepID=UPI002573889C|nr:plasmid replication initiator TrfA [Paraburkholderia bonniea]WJF90208.1 plasmid replication initiator TrfA [Paraburkholderia bonniea]WJF93522.1 plasmid replication initiator TrfA [Paraburkholderia bonniea]